MFHNLLHRMGINLYCVTFTLTNTHHEYCGMIVIMTYAPSEAKATQKVIKRLNRRCIMFTGDWNVDVEQV